MAFINFPDVPKLPGVPPLPRSPEFPTSVRSVLGLIQGALWRTAQISSQWGIFNSAGESLGNPDNFLNVIGIGSTLSTGGVDYSKETRVSDFPIERGSFASYNKVEMPATPKVTLCFGGSESDRRAFLEAVDAACKSTELYSVVTPEVTYIDYSLEKYDYQRRSNKGATMLMVEITLKEIRQVSSTYSVAAKQIEAPKDVGATPNVDGGKVQPQTPNTSTLKSLFNKLPSLVN